jgi:hypothetical protein
MKTAAAEAAAANIYSLDISIIYIEKQLLGLGHVDRSGPAAELN